MTYVIIGTILVWPASHRAQNAAVALVAFAYVPLASTIVAMDIRGGAGSIFIVFGAYLVAAVWACLGVGLMLRRHPHAWQMRLFVVGAAFGMVDFLLPAVAFLGVPIWRPEFLGRLLDCLFYLTPAVVAIVWLDAQPQYKLKEPRDDADGVRR